MLANRPRDREIKAKSKIHVLISLDQAATSGVMISSKNLSRWTARAAACSWQLMGLGAEAAFSLNFTCESWVSLHLSRAVQASQLRDLSRQDIALLRSDWQGFSLGEAQVWGGCRSKQSSSSSNMRPQANQKFSKLSAAGEKPEGNKLKLVSMRWMDEVHQKGVKEGLIFGPRSRSLFLTPHELTALSCPKTEFWTCSSHSECHQVRPWRKNPKAKRNALGRQYHTCNPPCAKLWD